MGVTIAAARYSDSMEFRVLGPVEVLEEGNRLDLGGPKQLTVLALLVANAGQSVSADRLIESVYGDEAPLAGKSRRALPRPGDARGGSSDHNPT